MPEDRQQPSDEIIFGKNAVLAFLERSAEGRAPRRDGDKSPEEEVIDTLARLRTQLPQSKRPVPDLKQLETLATIRINKVMVAEGGRPDPRMQRIMDLARRQRIPVQTCDRRKLDQLVGPQQRHQGVVALIAPAEMWHLDTLLQKVELDRAAREQAGKSMDGYVLALLDGIEDPHNLGAIIRVAESAGVEAVLLPQRRTAGLTGTVAKISAGALANLPVVRVGNLVQAIETLKNSGFWVVGLDSAAPQVYTEADLCRPLLVIIGSEGTGMGRLVRENCDFLVRIPMLGKTESLNASVAAGVFFYEVVRQCGSQGG